MSADDMGTDDMGTDDEPTTDRTVLDDAEILEQIQEMIDTEHKLRDEGSDEARTRLEELEGALDQCWDLLRQRRTRREFGENPDDAQLRPVAEVETYRQ